MAKKLGTLQPSVFIIENKKGNIFIVENKNSKPQVEKILESNSKKDNSYINTANSSPILNLKVKTELPEYSVIQLR